MSPRLPAVPVPPTDLSAPHTASVVFLILCCAVTAFALAYALKRLRAGDPLALVFLVGGLLAGFLEPMIDYLCLLWFAADNVAIAVETFHRHVPLYVVLGYAFYFGGFSYVAYRALTLGKGRRWFWAFFAFDLLADFGLQATGRALGLYQYYGPQPWMVLGVPMWGISIDSAMPAVCGGTLFLLRNHLMGWRLLLIVPFIPAAYAGLVGATGWPVFSALNSGPATVVIWLAGAATIALAIGFRWLVVEAAVRAQERDGLASATEPAPAARGSGQAASAAT